MTFTSESSFQTRLHRTELQQKLKYRTSVKVLFSQWFSHDENAKIKKVKCNGSGEIAQFHNSRERKESRKASREKHKQQNRVLILSGFVHLLLFVVVGHRQKSRSFFMFTQFWTQAICHAPDWFWWCKNFLISMTLTFAQVQRNVPSTKLSSPANC